MLDSNRSELVVKTDSSTCMWISDQKIWDKSCQYFYLITSSTEILVFKPWFLFLRCYNNDIRSSCCGTCTAVAKGDATCPYGDRDLICSISQTIDCSNEVLRNLCCDKCRTTTTPATTRATSPAVTPPSDCKDTLPTCSQLTNPASTCYAVSYHNFYL